jgi:hypothetical protein
MKRRTSDVPSESKANINAKKLTASDKQTLATSVHQDQIVRKKDTSTRSITNASSDRIRSPTTTSDNQQQYKKPLIARMRTPLKADLELILSSENRALSLINSRPVSPANVSLHSSNSIHIKRKYGNFAASVQSASSQFSANKAYPDSFVDYNLADKENDFNESTKSDSRTVEKVYD